MLFYIIESVSYKLNTFKTKKTADNSSKVLFYIIDFVIVIVSCFLVYVSETWKLEKKKRALYFNNFIFFINKFTIFTFKNC